MKICFAITKMVQQASGGYKMVFEYANRLIDRGYDVSILFFNMHFLKKFGMPEIMRKCAANFLTHIGPVWFQLDKRIELISSEEKEVQKKLDGIDAVVYTAVESVYFGKRYFSDCKKKLYFIQGYEVGNLSETQVKKTYGMGFDNIVVAQWLKKIVDKYSSKPAVVIKNPIDTLEYTVKNPIKKRKKHSLSVLYNGYEGKGFKYVYDAILKLKNIYPDLSVECFGTPAKARYFPDYFHYTRNASKKKTIQIYNSTAVFLCASIEEGYGLTGLEAMSCGTALVSTAYKGVLEYAENEKNALLSPVRDVDALVKNACRLFDDDDLRISIAENGVASVKNNFDWGNAVDRFEAVLKGNE